MPIGFHELDERLRVVDRRRGEDAMPQIEDVSMGSGVLKNSLGGGRKIRCRAQQSAGIEIALKRDTLSYAGTGFSDRYAPVDAKDVGS